MGKLALVADVCVSELGWELMAHQGRVRYHAQNTDYVVVCSSDYLQPLYADICDKFIGHRIKGNRSCHMMKDVTTSNAKQMAHNDVDDTCEELRAAGYKVKRIKARGWERYPHEQLLVPLGNADRARERGHDYRVILHARNRPTGDGFTGSNYPPASWAPIAGWAISRGLKTCCIGTSEQAFAIPRVDDMRDMDFGELMDMVAAARIVIGPSSGPIHLASLCRTPHVTWSHMRKALSMGCTNKERYETVWNPFETAVGFIPTELPEPYQVFMEMEKMLRKYPSERGAE